METSPLSPMDWLDGVLLVPPERNQILGRTSWKARYVVIGRRNVTHKTNQNTNGPGLSRSNTSGHKPLVRTQTEDYCISVYKSKDDLEAIQQWPLNCVSDCQVQMQSHRKQEPALPTLVVAMSDKDRKRRSTRAAGLVATNKDAGSMTLWFRLPQDDVNTSLHDWSRFILSRRGSSDAGSPISPNFSSPYAGRSRDPSEYFSQPSSNRSECRALQHKSSAATYSTGPRERPVTFSSASPSLRSKRSDVSSPSSTNYPIQKMTPHVPGQHYTTVGPGDIVSPGAIPEHHAQATASWAGAPGRISTISSPALARDSVMSQPPNQALTDACAPPAPGETILDRAFQLGHIPGMSPGIPGEEKLSSIARFDALMRESNERRRQREAVERAQQAEQMGLRSTFEEDDSSDEEEDSNDSEGSNSGSDDSDSQNFSGSEGLISPSAQRALDFIAGRDEMSRNTKSHRPGMSRAHLSFHAHTASATDQFGSSRPHTAHGKGRPNLKQRTQSTPHLAHIMAPQAANLDIPIPSTRQPADGSRHQANPEKRYSNSSTKRSSFTEFTKRLSSTSSLLLVQTNASGGSSRRSSEIDTQSTSVARTNLSFRGGVPPPRNHRDRDETNRGCGWRNGVNVVGSEGGFL